MLSKALEFNSEALILLQNIINIPSDRENYFISPLLYDYSCWGHFWGAHKWGREEYFSEVTEQSFEEGGEGDSEGICVFAYL